MIDVDAEQGFGFDLVAEFADLTGADKATLTLRSSAGVAPVLVKSTASGMTISVAQKRITATIAPADLAALQLGTYLAEVAVRFGSDQLWFSTPQFRFNVTAQVASTV